jgi:hypothetical protein
MLGMTTRRVPPEPLPPPLLSDPPLPQAANAVASMSAAATACAIRLPDLTYDSYELGSALTEEAVHMG